MWFNVISEWILFVLIAVPSLIVVVHLVRSCGEPPDPDVQPGVRDVEALLRSRSRPAFRLVPVPESTCSFLGGDVAAADELDVPRVNGRPLDLLACIDLSRVGDIGLTLPTSGRLLFYFDVETQAWGFAPEDSAHWAVRYVEESDLPESFEPRSGRPCRFLEFEAFSSLPSAERVEAGPIVLSNAEVEELHSLVESNFEGGPVHQWGGLPIPLQADEMELECQLASNGIDVGGPEGYEDPRVESSQAGAMEWRLLLQLDSDDALEWMWGDAGTLYFWIRESDASAGDFSNVWVVLQCG